ncbi:MAG TPA: carbohydrate ABC transporter permease [Mycobacteriales bacterium]|jgi:ABC-type glycerol-3-phosphate transport system permease component|nr:carbohydrate ABC transporter permease [Mycobacteriales bacterium]
MSVQTRTVPRQVATYVLLVVVAVLFLIPLLWLLSIAFKNAGELASSAWLPHSLSWANFHDALTLIPFGRYALTSVLLATVQATLTTLSSAMVGFGFARLRARGKRPLFLIVVATLMLPQIVTLIPTYLIFARIHLIYTYWPWVLWGLAGSAFLIFLFRQTFTSMPMDLEDAAIIDGCGYFRIFATIFLPLAKAVTVTGFILSFTAAWGDFIAPSLFLSQDQTTLAVGLSNGYQTAAGTPLNNALAAGAILYILPILLLFVVAQRAFIGGFVTSGLK